MEVGDAHDGYRLSIQSLTVGGTAWADETTCDVVNGRVQFSVNHTAKFVAALTATSAPKPVATTLSSASGQRGATIAVTGKGFGARRGISTAEFGATICTKYVSSTATRIQVKVPAKAALGKLKVTLRTKAGMSAAKSFRVKR
jgi:hypothetical protein